LKYGAHAGSSECRRQFSTSSPPGIDVSHTCIDEDRRFTAAKEEAPNGNVHEPVIIEQVLMGAEVEPDVELLRQHARSITERHELDVAYVHVRVRS
jgi:hypothetical protein